MTIDENQCPECGKVFARKKNLTWHVFVNHANPKPYSHEDYGTRPRVCWCGESMTLSSYEDHLHDLSIYEHYHRAILGVKK